MNLTLPGEWGQQILNDLTNYIRKVGMKTKYSEEKIVQILDEVVAGAKVLKTCRNVR